MKLIVTEMKENKKERGKEGEWEEGRQEDIFG